MIRPIMRNQLFLAMPSEAATIEDMCQLGRTCSIRLKHTLMSAWEWRRT